MIGKIIVTSFRCVCHFLVLLYIVKRGFILRLYTTLWSFEPDTYFHEIEKNTFAKHENIK